MANNYLTQPELVRLERLLAYLNINFIPSVGGLAADITVIDSNGEEAATITYETAAEAYVLRAL